MPLLLLLGCGLFAGYLLLVLLFRGVLKDQCFLHMIAEQQISYERLYLHYSLLERIDGNPPSKKTLQEVTIFSNCPTPCMAIAIIVFISCICATLQTLKYVCLIAF